MATDVARVSFDWARFYRGVIPQQGRVTLEAEQNEQRVIDSEERCKELIDIVGPAGTPDDGYLISGAVDFTIGAGTMYVGGLRVELDADITYSTQPDWLDHGPDQGSPGKTNEFVVLTLRDTDVTAVEDPVLYEVALGGPDSSGRTRLLQRVTRSSTNAGSCSAALSEAETAWTADGLTLDPATMALKSSSRLFVTWESNPKAPDPCEPSSAGGYLGAENQLIRVQVVNVDMAKKTCDLIWGYDDASFLYRVTPDASANPVLTLDRSPVDDFHRPRAGQALQVLRAAAKLQTTDGVVEGYVAELGGQVGVLAAPYDPDTKTVQFPAPLPPEFTDTKQTPRLFLRVWEERLTGLGIGAPVSLTGTGMQVTITADGGGSLHLDDFWCIAVRPSTPSTVYPDRYLRTPQPPDGPRLWACPLAVIGWQEGKVKTLEDCRNHFKPLIDQTAGGGCCVVDVQPTDGANLQALIDKAVAGRNITDRSSRVAICFQAGRYELTAPIVLRKAHSNLTLSACGDAVVLAARAGSEQAFEQGLVIVAEADDVTISGFEFDLMPSQVKHIDLTAVPFGAIGQEAAKLATEAIGGRLIAVGIRAVTCAGLDINNCLIRFAAGGQVTTDIGFVLPPEVFGVGVFAAGVLRGLRLRQNRFVQDVVAAGRYLAGFVLNQNAIVGPGMAAGGNVGGFRLRAGLDDAEIAGNEFSGLTAAILVEAELGDVRIWDNVIQNCYLGISLVEATVLIGTDFAREYVAIADAQEMQLVRAAMVGGLLDQLRVSMLMLGTFYPLPTPTGYVPAGVSEYDLANMTKLRAEADKVRQAEMSNFVRQIATELPPAGAGGAAPATPFIATELAAGIGVTTNVNFNAPGGASATIPQASGNLLAIWNAMVDLVRFDRPLGGLSASLRVERNNVECRIASKQFTGHTLFLYTLLRERFGGGSAMVDANRLISLQAAMAAAVVGPSAATINGNFVAAPKSTVALDVAAVQAPAITGNVVEGRAVLPAGRPFPAPLNTWLPLNTIV